MITKIIESLVAGNDLSFDESYQVMLKIMNGEVNNSQIAALLIALKIKGEQAEEIAGSARAMRKMSVKVKSDLVKNAVDVCGTGGDNSGTFNISTATAFVAAGAGVKVAKHGNRSISSNSGSADVLKELGVNINLSPQKSTRALEEIGITFLFAPDYHTAMKHVAPVRKELGMKTIFNILGPLTNPAGTKKQLIGTFNVAVAEKMAQAAEYIDMERVCFICTDNRFDEITLSGVTNVIDFSENGISKYQLSPSSFGYSAVEIDKIKGDTPSYNAEIIRDLFSSNEKTSHFYVTSANAAMGLRCAGFSEDLHECVKAAEDSILSGKALKKLDQLIEFDKEA